MIVSASIALDFGHTYLIQSENQRIADVAAVEAALVYSQSLSAGSTSTAAQTAANSAAESFAVSNGSGGDAVAATYVASSPSGDGNAAEKVTVTATVSLSPFSRLVTTATSISTAQSAWAEISSASPCVIALASPGISASNGSTSSGITATSCDIASDGNITAVSPTITGQAVYAVGTISPTGSSCGNGCVKSSPTAGRVYAGYSAPSDPYASQMTAPFAYLTDSSTYPAGTAPTQPSAPSGGGTAVTTCGSTISAGNYTAMTLGAWGGSCTITFSGSASTPTKISGSGITINGNATLNLGAGSYYIEQLTVSGGGTLTVNVTPPATLDFWNGISNASTTTFNGTATYQVFSKGIASSGTAITFANTSSSQPSTFNIAGGIDITGGSATFPDGAYTITSADGNGYGIDVNNGNMTATFGNGSYNIAGGINLGGGGTLTLGNGGNSDTNANTSFVIPSYATNNGYAVNTSGGSTLTLGSFSEYDIDGPVNFSGNVALGSGVYYINSGSAAIGFCGGCQSGGSTITGSGVSIITAGSFDFANGYSSISLSAPSSGSTSGIALATPYSSTSQNNQFSGGTSGTTIVGAVYMPNSPLNLNNGGAISGGGNCLEVVAYSITLTNGTSITTTCSSTGGSSSNLVALVK